MTRRASAAATPPRRRRPRSVLWPLLCAPLAGCVVVPPPPPPETTIELVNETDLVVDANFYVSAEASDEGGLFVGPNLYTDWTTRAIPTLRRGERVTFTLECDQIAAMGVLRPFFSNPVTFSGGGASDDKVFLRRELNFACGDTLRFVYFEQDGSFHVRFEPR